MDKLESAERASRLICQSRVGLIERIELESPKERALADIEQQTENIYLTIPRENRASFAGFVLSYLENVWNTSESFEAGAREVWEILKKDRPTRERGRRDLCFGDEKYWYKKKGRT